MSESAGPLAITGDKWLSTLHLAEYETGETSECTQQSFDDLGLDSPLHQHPRLASGGKISKLTAFVINLGFDWSKHVKELLTHHLVEVETDDGNVFTFEKLSPYILVKCCPGSTTMASTAPTVRERKIGIPRSKLDTLRKIVVDSNPPDATVKDVFRWIHDKDELKEKYHVANSNCQHFAANLWNRFSNEPYPNPSKYKGARWRTSSTGK